MMIGLSLSDHNTLTPLVQDATENTHVCTYMHGPQLGHDILTTIGPLSTVYVYASYWAITYIHVQITYHDD